MEQGAHVDPPCDLVAHSSLNQHEVPSSIWPHFAARSSWGQLVDEEEGFLMRHCLGVYLYYALAGSATSHADVVGILQARSETRQLALEAHCFL